MQVTEMLEYVDLVCDPTGVSAVYWNNLVAPSVGVWMS